MKFLAKKVLLVATIGLSLSVGDSLGMSPVDSGIEMSLEVDGLLTAKNYRMVLHSVEVARVTHTPLVMPQGIGSESPVYHAIRILSGAKTSNLMDNVFSLQRAQREGNLPTVQQLILNAHGAAMLLAASTIAWGVEETQRQETKTGEPVVAYLNNNKIIQAVIAQAQDMSARERVEEDSPVAASSTDPSSEEDTVVPPPLVAVNGDGSRFRLPSTMKRGWDTSYDLAKRGLGASCDLAKRGLGASYDLARRGLSASCDLARRHLPAVKNGVTRLASYTGNVVSEGFDAVMQKIDDMADLKRLKKAVVAAKRDLQLEEDRLVAFENQIQRGIVARFKANGFINGVLRGKPETAEETARREQHNRNLRKEKEIAVAIAKLNLGVLKAEIAKIERRLAGLERA